MNELSRVMRVIQLAGLVLALGWSSVASAQYLLAGDSRGGLQIGTGLPLPVGPAGIFLGGMTPVNGGTSCGTTTTTGGATGVPKGCPVPGGVDGPGKAYWPPLLIPPAANISTGGTATRTVMQNLATTMGGTITVPTAALTKPAPGTPTKIGVFTTNPALFQVATSISFAWPAASAVLAPSGAPGIPGTPVFATGTATGMGVIAYNGGAKAFGGAGQFALVPGPGAAGGRAPANAASVAPIATVWINFAGGLPGTVKAIAIAGASAPGSLGQPGAALTATPVTTMFGPVTPAAGPFGALNVVTTMTTTMPTPSATSTMTICLAFCATPMGSITASVPLPSITVPTPMGTMTAMLPGLTNMVTISRGFPWTTGLITVSQPAASPPEVFWLSGTDMRVAGVGNVSLVSGALSVRKLSGPNANRGWVSLTLPEPTVALGAFGALAVLAVCHAVVRRRSR